ncbi:unnamed protein product [Tuber aestivum]|uniref:Protein arginine N-methyltransferase n=1 Tax=Tuber aestivum TaxID=59557 RepID=A0A292Q1A7_9PEZI|nr:unnamed protein product [Tuber aestivum]
MDAHQPTDPGASLWYIGNHLPTPDLTISGQTLEDETAQGYDMITTFITNTNFRSRINQVLLNATAEKRTHMRIDSLDAEEVTVHPGDHISQVIGFVSPWLEFDSDDLLVSHVSKQALLYELDYAGFCGIGNVVISGPRKKENVPRFAQIISTALSANGYAHLLILLPLAEKPSCTAEGDEYDEFSAWDTWNTIRTVCKYNPRLSLALQIPAELPTLHVINRWFAEPIRVVLLSSSTFSPNPTGYPALSKLHQALLTKYTKQRPTPFILLSDQRVVVNEKVRYEPTSYLVYIRHLQKNQPPQSTVERYSSGYQDYLQTPLQPLSDNLESITYEVFEKDPVKYDQYEKAIKLALDARDAASSTVVAVVGAGRGPLVSRALRAAQASGRAIMLFAIEKNPNAYVHLLRHNRDTWNGQVTVIKSDMRSWNPPFAVDILVSELLGSFGDNELSPECLDGVQRVLNPSGGISIPVSYSAHFTPIMAPKIHADISSRKNDSEAAETPYVVMLQSFEMLAEQKYIHRAWEFTHPLPPNVLSDSAALGGGLIGLGDGGNDHNARKCKATFKVPRRGVVHGLAGYFESVLYGDVELSTRPDTIDMKSKDMISWFPIFFPLKAPLHVPDNCELDVCIWRQTSERKVWYEWVVEAFFRNGGQRCCLGATDLHSSKQNGCLM